MTELQMLWAYMRARIANVRGDDDRSDAGFTTLEWMAIAGIVVAAAIVIATVLMTKGKDAASNLNVQ